MGTERVWNSVARPSVRVVRGSDGAGSHRRTLEDGVLAVCFLALVGVVLLGALLTLFSWVTTLPTNPPNLCRELDACPVTPDQGQTDWIDQLRMDQQLRP